jgi:hypothetical protein
MDAFVVSKLIKNSLQPRKTAKYVRNSRKLKEHADFMMPNDSYKFGADGSVNQETNSSNTTNSAESILMDSMSGNNMQTMSMPSDLDDANTTNNISITNIEVTNVEVEDERQEMNQKTKADRLSTTTFILMLFINSYAAYLSWDCNTKNNYPLSLKIVFSLFAFMFGSFYLLYYILFRFDNCNRF